MRPLTEEEDAVRAPKAFDALFDFGPTPGVVRLKTPCRALLYPLDYVLLTPTHLDAISAGARVEASTDAFMASLGAPGHGWPATFGKRVITVRDYEDYRPNPSDTVLEHVLFATDASWGVATSDAEFAVVGGSAAFMSEYRARLAVDEDDMLGTFIKDMREVVEKQTYDLWVEPLISHIYGETTLARFR